MCAVNPWAAQGRTPYIIAEIGVNHDGSAERALDLVSAAADAGADAIKLQYFKADLLLSRASRLAAYQRDAGETDPANMLRRLELAIADMARIADRARALGVDPIVTVFNVDLVAEAERIGWAAYKTASPDIIHKPLLEALAATGRPMIVSTGAATIEEVGRAVDWLSGARDRLSLLHCVSAYPTPIERAALGGVAALRDAFNLPTGYSDHTRETETGALAAEAGAVILEKHLTYSRAAAGPDHAASLEPAGFAEYVALARAALRGGAAAGGTALRAVREQRRRDNQPQPSQCIIPDHASRASDHVRKVADCVRSAHGSGEPCHPGPATKTLQDIEADVRRLSRQSLVTTRAIAAGETVALQDITCKRPGSGLEPWRLEDSVGRVAARDLEADMPIREGDLR